MNILRNFLEIIKFITDEHRSQDSARLIIIEGLFGF